ncbi:phage antirepressor N-terminal domain-containing protein [Parasediminibacterium paludis]|uniref:Phage antirepressor N-terminal domain-containing protein n=1 Tax=Parasediminibacterium paludis TaxID=908966 RepID=A0ABV8PW49_9BACT
MTTEKFLDFNGKKLTLVNEDGKFFIALKPIIEVLDIDWDNHKKWLQNHPIFKSVKVNITSTGSDGKSYKMVCLPEKFVYGWLLSFTPKTEEHIAFQRECYDVLYGHFHNALNMRQHDLLTRQQMKDEYQKLHFAKMNEDADYKRMIELEQAIKSVNKNLTSQDESLLAGQALLDFEAK